MPELSHPDEGELWDALRELDSAYVSFFISFIAFYDTTLAVLFWFGGIPLQIFVLNRYEPRHADDFIG